MPVDRWHNIIGEPTIADPEMPNDNRPGVRHPADIDRNRWPAWIGTGGRHHSECPADFTGIRMAPILIL
jgi:hypothetical protein